MGPPNTNRWLCAALMLLLAIGAARATAQSPATQPTTQPTTGPATQPTTAPTAEEEKQEARLTKELANEQAVEAQDQLEAAREKKTLTEEAVEAGLVPGVSDTDRDRLDLEVLIAERQVRLADLRARFAEQRETLAQRRQAVEDEIAAINARVAALDDMTAAERAALAGEYETAAAGQRAIASDLRQQAEALTAPQVAEFLKAQRELAERRQATPETSPLHSALREALDQIELMLMYQRAIGSAIEKTASAEYHLGEAYEGTAAALREANRAFWVRYARAIAVTRIVIIAIAAHTGINLLCWTIVWVTGRIARRAHGEYATPTIKRVRTIVRFARSIAKLLLWSIVIVTTLEQFGIDASNSAGALGVIGLVLAGMFREVVVDFVKGIDIAIGGHYFVGDFIQCGAHSGHVLNFTVKYTVLRTPSGQVITVPNSQCIPSRRFPAGYVDNYVDLPLERTVDAQQVQRVLTAVGRTLNARVEAVKREPCVVHTFDAGTQRIWRVQVRVLPTCDWVLRDHYIPMLKAQLEQAGITLAGEPALFFYNDVPTFRRLFSRQMTDRDLQQTLAAESRPTIERDAIPDETAEPGQSLTGEKDRS